MKKVEITEAYKSLNQWFQTLTEVNEQKWFTPIDEGKWTMAACISHLLFWDRFTIEERLPFIKEGASLPPFPDFQSVNNKAREYAESGITKNELLQELIQVRLELLTVISAISEEELDTAFLIGDHQLTIRDYFGDFLQHDFHHKNQIEAFLS